MLDKLKVSKIIFINEIKIDELIEDYAKFIALKLFQEEYFR